MFTGFSGHGNSIHNIIPLLKKENLDPITVTCDNCRHPYFDICLDIGYGRGDQDKWKEKLNQIVYLFQSQFPSLIPCPRQC